MTSHMRLPHGSPDRDSYGRTDGRTHGDPHSPTEDISPDVTRTRTYGDPAAETSECTRRPGSVWIHCRCVNCAPAAARLRKLHRSGLVGVSGRDQAWRRLARWRAAGWSPRTVRAMTGLAISTIRHLFLSIDAGQRIPIQQTTVNAILASDGRPTGTGRVPAIGSTRRVQALGVTGWSARDLRDRAGIAVKTTQALRRGIHPDITADTANKVAAAYDELWDVPGPSGARASTVARNAGWAPPMAWDDDTMDDPEATPDSTAARRRGGGRPFEDTVEDVEFLLRHVDRDMTGRQIGERLGVTADSITCGLRRMRDTADNEAQRERADRLLQHVNHNTIEAGIASSAQSRRRRVA